MVTNLAKAINRNKPFYLAWGSPLKHILTGQEAVHSALLPGGQYARGQGFLLFCLAPSIHKQIRPIRLIRGKIGIQRTGASLTRRRISLWLQGSLFVLPTAAILFSGGLEGPAWQDWELRHRAAAKTRLEQRPMTEDPRRNAP